MKFFERLLRLLRDIHASNQEIAQAIRANTDAHNKKQEPSPSVVAPLKLPEAIAAYYEAEQNERKRNNFWKSIERLAAIVAAVLSLVAVIFTYCTLQQITRQANVAQRQLEASIESFRVDERAWIELEPPAPILKVLASPTYWGSLFTYDCFLKNVGRTAAFNIAVRAPRGATMAALAFGDNSEYVGRYQEALRRDAVFPKAMNPEDRVILLSERNSKTLGPGVRAFSPFQMYGQEPSDGTYRFLIGRIDYEDAFGVSHWSTFCFFIDTGGQLRYCREGNDKDRNPEISPKR